jgi:hypothetical protein
MTKRPVNFLTDTTRLRGALGRMKPKSHVDLKLKPNPKKAKSLGAKRATSAAKT